MPYDLRLTELAKENRQKQTQAEAKLWEIFRSKRLEGYKFIRQKPISKFILDFYCSELLLGIEVDGASHYNKKEADNQRTAILNDMGIDVIRFSNEAVINDLEKVRQKLLELIDKRKNNTHAWF